MQRPGVDKFLSTLANYYEIVLMSPSLPQNAEPVIAALDKERYIMHHVFREGLHYIDGVHVKDLSKLNRPVNRIVVIDDDRDAVKLHPDNLIKVKPYTDKHDREDNTLLNLIPILVEVSERGGLGRAHFPPRRIVLNSNPHHLPPLSPSLCPPQIAKSNTKDIPATLYQFRGMDADQIASEYNRRVQGVRDQAAQASSSGLGSFARTLPPPDLAPQTVSVAKKSGLTSKDLMGDVSGADKVGGGGKKGGVTDWWEQRNKDKAELQIIKQQKWQEVMIKREEKKKAKQDIN